MSANSTDSRVCPEGSLTIDSAARDPLAVLLLSTDILREYGGRLSGGMLKEQREAMHLAAEQLTSAMNGKAIDR
jgi:hypothetical protein